MNLKKALTILCLGLFLNVAEHREVAQAGPFDEAFGMISALSQSHRSYRSYKRSRRLYRRRVRRARAARYRYAKRRRLYAQRRAALRARRRAAAQARRFHKRRIAQIRRNKARRLARAQQVKRVRNQNRAVKMARQNKLRARQQARVRKANQSRSLKIAATNRAIKIEINLEKKSLKTLPKHGLRKRHNSRPAEPTKIIEQARNKLAYGWREEEVYLGYTEKIKVQRALAHAGFYQGQADGKFGRYTRKAIHAYQRSIDQPRTGRLNKQQLASLLTASAKLTAKDSGYLPQADQKQKHRDAIRAKAKALNEKLKLAALTAALTQVQQNDVVPPKKALVNPSVKAQVKKRLKPNVMPRPVPKLRKPEVKSSWPKIVSKQSVQKASVKPARHKARQTHKAGRKVIFSKLQPKQKQQARLTSKVEMAKTPKAIKQASLQKKTLQPVPKKQKQVQEQRGSEVRKVDYFHILGRTAGGENLWVVKCFNKNQLKVYFWKDQKWWVRGANAGPIGYSKFGQNGIQKLARRVCEI